jgi:hypothetical protein
MAKVFVVTSGCYSEYGIDGIFSTKENAEDYAQTLFADDINIEEWDLDEKKPDLNEKEWFVNIDVCDGHINDAKCVIVQDNRDENLFDVRFLGMVRYACTFSFEFLIKSNRKDKAIKIASDRVTAILATPYKYDGLQAYIHGWRPEQDIKCVRYNFSTGVVVAVNGFELNKR